MWTRVQLKENAKRKLRNYYWLAVAVCLVVSFLGGGGGVPSASVNNSMNANQVLEHSEGADVSREITSDPFGGMRQFLKDYEVPGYEYSYNFTPLIVLVVAIVVLFALAIGIAISVFVANPIIVGARKFFINAGSGNQPRIGDVFFAFKGEYYLNIVKVMFIYNLKIFAWSLLLIIPGIVKSYEYSMIPYLLAEDPLMSSKDAFAMTKRMTDGEKFDIFVLGLSFLGWMLLIYIATMIPIFIIPFIGLIVGALVAQAGSILLNPYIFATMTELYFALKAKIYYTDNNVQGGYDEVC